MAERESRSLKRNLAYIGVLAGSVGVAYTLWTQGGQLSPEQVRDQIAPPSTPTPTQTGVLPPAAGQLFDDARKTPLRIQQEIEAALPSVSGALTAISPDVNHPSEYMPGTTVVDIIFADKESWTKAEDRNMAEAQIRQALAWWESQGNGNVHFMVKPGHVEDTTVNPISLPSTQESQWIGEIFTRLGVQGADHFQQWYNYDQKLRQEAGTDWATTIFLVNGSNDTNGDGKFADGKFSYEYVGGPGGVRAVNLHNPEIAGSLNTVESHEKGHTFQALDQYPGAKVDCNDLSGYQKKPTSNSQYNKLGGLCPMNLPSIMRGLDQLAVDPALAAQVGLVDSTPGVGFNVDVAGEVQPQLSIIPEGGKVRVSGIVDISAPQPGGGNSAIRINWMVGGSILDPITGHSAPLIPKDRKFDSPHEEVTATIEASTNANLELIVAGHIGGNSVTRIDGSAPDNQGTSMRKVFLALVTRY